MKFIKNVNELKNGELEITLQYKTKKFDVTINSGFLKNASVNEILSELQEYDLIEFPKNKLKDLAKEFKALSAGSKFKKLLDDVIS
jgi:hypothetical protein